MNWFSLARPIIHAMQPETAHDLTIKALRFGLVPTPPPQEYESLHTTVCGLHFLNPIGMAAGFDKNAEVVSALAKHGFGFVEAGTVTPLPQAGNPKPRIFRLEEDEAAINRLGFNNKGADAFYANMKRARTKRIVGANIGKNKTTENATSDYVLLLKRVYDVCDYITVNISSPNTEGLRKLQERKQLDELIKAIYTTREKIVEETGTYKPVFVKIAPDNTPEQLEDIVIVAKKYEIDGLIVSNTTISRPETLQSVSRNETGGLSGKPLFDLSTANLKIVYRLSEGKIPLIGVGGISSGEDAYAKIRAGASLIQIYTAFIYQGFGLIQEIKDTLVACLERDGFSHISEAVGVDVRGE
jgi:dihydroorotate dehydrogenase